MQRVTLRVRKLEGNTSVSGQRKSQSNRSDRTCGSSEGQGKDVDDGDSKLQCGNDPTGDDVKWCDMAGTNNKLTITVISCSTQKKGSCQDGN